ncbi:MAG: hypothetical protein ABI977_30665 [Acidobacteriota bacterium]
MKKFDATIIGARHRQAVADWQPPHDPESDALSKKTKHRAS